MRLVPHSAVAALLLACQPPTLTSQVAVSGSWRTVTWPPSSLDQERLDVGGLHPGGAELDPDLAGAQVGRLDRLQGGDVARVAAGSAAAAARAASSLCRTSPDR